MTKILHQKIENFSKTKYLKRKLIIVSILIEILKQKFEYIDHDLSFTLANTKVYIIHTFLKSILL